MLIILILISANRCPPVPPVELAEADNQITNVGVQVSITCQKGYSFKSKVFTEKIECNNKRQWEGFVETDICLG